MKTRLLLTLLISSLGCGCQSVGILDQENLQRPAMSFNATGTRSTEGRLSGQIETGRSTGVGVAAGGCASCN